MDLVKLIDWIKLTPRYLLPLVIVCAALLFSPQSFVATLGLSYFRDHYRSWIGLAFLLSAALVASHLVIAAVEPIKSILRLQLALRPARQRLHNLTHDEKVILRRYIENRSRTARFPPGNGLVRELEALQILQQASAVGDMVNGFPYNILPCAWDYLNKHKDLLED